MRPLPAVALIAALLAPVAPARAGDPIYENPGVRVYRNDYPPRVRAAMHGHAAGRFVYVLEGGPLRIRTPQGEESEIELIKGQAFWRLPERHGFENMGSETIRLLEVDVKAAVGEAASEEDAIDLGPPEGVEDLPGRAIAFRNGWGAVVAHRIARDTAMAPALPGFDRLVYWFTSAQLRIVPEDGFERIVTRSAGSFEWFPAGREPSGVSIGPGTVEAVEIVFAHPVPTRRKMIIRGLPSSADHNR